MYKNCMENVEQLRKVPSVVEAVRVETESDFEELKNAIKIFLEDPVPPTPSSEHQLNLAPSDREVLVDLQEGSGSHDEGYGGGVTSDHVTQNLSVPDDGGER